jgi:hypothetical protein
VRGALPVRPPATVLTTNSSIVPKPPGTAPSWRGVDPVIATLAGGADAGRMRMACIALLSTALVIPRLQQPAANEPPLRIELQIGAEKHAFVDGQEAELTIAGKPVKVKATVAATRRFEGGGIAFEFPRDMAFDHDQEDNLETWTLDGNDIVILVHRHSEGAAAAIAADTLASMLTALDPEAEKAKPCKLKLGGKEFDGVQGRVEMMDGLAVMEVQAAGVRVGTGSVVLMVQRAIDDGSEASGELERVLDLLAKTFTITSK